MPGVSTQPMKNQDHEEQGQPKYSVEDVVPCRLTEDLQNRDFLLVPANELTEAKTESPWVDCE